MSCRLNNYVRMYRRRAGLSQADVAFLLGSQSGTPLSRYERFRRLPALRTALALEIVFGIPAGEIFAGVYDELQRAIVERATMLTKELKAGKKQSAATARLAALEAIKLPRR